MGAVGSRNALTLLLCPDLDGSTDAAAAPRTSTPASSSSSRFHATRTRSLAPCKGFVRTRSGLAGCLIGPGLKMQIGPISLPPGKQTSASPCVHSNTPLCGLYIYVAWQPHPAFKWTEHVWLVRSRLRWSTEQCGWQSNQMNWL
jgi:hypothetical protein